MVSRGSRALVPWIYGSMVRCMVERINGLELSRPAHDPTCISTFPNQDHHLHIAQRAGSVAAMVRRRDGMGRPTYYHTPGSKR